MSMKRLFGGTAIEAQMHSLHSECKNVQKSVLTNVNWQRNASPYFQMFAFSFFGGNFICRFWRSLKVPWNPILTKDSTYPIQEEWNISNAM